MAQERLVRVWTFDLAAHNGRETEFRALLSAAERARAARLVAAPAARRFVLAHGLLRTLLGLRTDTPPGELELACDHRGKPQLAGRAASSGLAFNMSHSGDHLAVAIASGTPVGIDVESLRVVPDALRIAAQYFTTCEHAALAALRPADRDRAFLACWTRKEAVMKAHGRGLSLGLGQVPVGIEPLDTAALTVSVPGKIYAVRDLPGPSGAVGAIAAEGEAFTLLVRAASAQDLLDGAP